MNKNFAEFKIFKKQITIEDILKNIEERWCVVCYLIINWRIDELRERIQFEIPPRTYKMLAEHLYRYVYEDVMPPEEIASTILNIADDFIKGEPVKLRAGDYIALQGYMRTLK
jgi:hypothetical protein